MAGKKNLARAFNIADRARSALTDVCIEFTCRKQVLTVQACQTGLFIIFGSVEIGFD